MPITRYQTENIASASLNIKLLYVTHSKYDDDWKSFPHTHYFTELCYILKGKGNYLIEDAVYPISEGDFVIINPNVTHTETSVGDVPLEYIVIGVEGIRFSLHDDNKYFIFRGSQEQNSPMIYMNMLLSEIRDKQEHYELLCQDLLELLIIKLLRLTNLTAEATTSLKTSRECSKLKQYMEANYSQNITLETLAEISHLNKYYLVHAFTKRFGCSPINYLCEIRINASKNLLATTDYSITEIAQSSGFSSTSYFAQCFQKHCKMSASAYRKSCREAE